MAIQPGDVPGLPAGTVAVALSLTAPHPGGPGAVVGTADGDGVCLAPSARADVVADLVGWFVP